MHHTSAVGLLGGRLGLAQAHSGPLGTGEILWQGHVEDLVLQRVAACRHSNTHQQPLPLSYDLSRAKKKKKEKKRGCLTSCVCGFESLLSFGQEATIGPVQHGFDLVLWIV